MDAVQAARLDLSIEMASKPYLHDWVGAEEYPNTKALSDKKIEECRDVLTQAADGNTIWYYSDLPTMGNKFRQGSMCALTGLPWSEVRDFTIEERRAMGRQS